MLVEKRTKRNLYIRIIINIPVVVIGILIMAYVLVFTHNIGRNNIIITSVQS